MMKSVKMKKQQAGLAMLTVTMLLLISATSFTFYSVKSRVMEAKISSNDFRYRETFVNAEAGLEHAISFLSTSGWQDSVPGLAPDVVDGKNVYKLAKADVYNVAITDECAGCGLVTVASTGKGDSGTLERTISKIAVFAPAIEDIRSPLITAGGTTMTGAVHVLSKDPTLIDAKKAEHAINSGGVDVTNDGSLDTDGSPVKTNNAALRGDNLAKYLGVKETEWQDFANDTSKVIKISGCADLASAAAQSTQGNDPAAWKTVWVVGDCLVNLGSLGTASKPVSIVVQDGHVMNRDAAGNIIAGNIGNFYGLLYAFNTSATNTSRKYARLKFNVVGQFYGSLVFDYKYTFSYNSSLKVIYREDLLDMVKKKFDENLAQAYWLPGGWNDLS
ncbi:hypothetical protein [Motilimonas eburnea]|uniref:hypothetical protein n=1 Tax=Motilimonas eburnea TaxID=1737488 RepID=UPI001E4D42A2|nr:hypothetical protein [Motilimonas eburnea]MCE2572776.1 hypothetical protein [Motilimonas eburnea]